MKSITLYRFAEVKMKLILLQSQFQGITLRTNTRSPLDFNADLSGCQIVLYRVLHGCGQTLRGAVAQAKWQSGTKTNEGKRAVARTSLATPPFT